MNRDELQEEMEELNSAEDFLEYFDVAYERKVVQVNRLHILQRFHDYLDGAGDSPPSGAALRAFYAGHLRRAYEDFVHSDARREKVFRVFKAAQAQEVLVPLSTLTRRAG